MSGHSKWSSIKHKKGRMDAQRGKIFTKLIKEITVAARAGGGDPGANPRLRTAVQSAKDANMPADNIERAIKKGTGELPGVKYEEFAYEGYGPNGVAILVETLSDNKNRTTADIRHIFGKYNGRLGEAGCVAWIFEQKGLILVDEEKCDEDTLLSVALEAGADDVKPEDGTFEVVTTPADFEKVRQAIADGGIEYLQAEMTKIPQSLVRLDGSEAQKTLRLVEALEDHDDVQKVHANFDIDESIMETME
ncbi:MAG: YebC/PmpR family DNA-binding transcriptional regulator [Gemmatimonadota bacterium]|nr:MAG: YebC/PmpR family DNA-binding transcriptional regulator [Gemmatimonadota bacterium]